MAQAEGTVEERQGKGFRLSHAREGDARIVELRPRRLGLRAFLGVWLAIWTAGAVGMAVQAAASLSAGSLGAALAMLAGVAVGVVVLAMECRSFQRFRIASDGVVHEARTLFQTRITPVAPSTPEPVRARAIVADIEGDARELYWRDLAELAAELEGVYGAEWLAEEGVDLSDPGQIMECAGVECAVEIQTASGAAELGSGLTADDCLWLMERLRAALA